MVSSASKVSGAVAGGLAMASPLGLVAVGLGAVNLGVSVFTGYQTYQMRKELKVLRGSVSGIETGVRSVQRTVDRGFNHLGSRIEVVQSDVHQMHSDLNAFADFCRCAFTSVQTTLQRQSHMLGLLLENQEATHQALQQLRLEVSALLILRKKLLVLVSGGFCCRREIEC